MVLDNDDLHHIEAKNSIVDAVRKPVEQTTANARTNLLELLRASNDHFESGVYFRQKLIFESGSLPEIVVGRFVNVTSGQRKDFEIHLN